MMGNVERLKSLGIPANRKARVQGCGPLVAVTSSLEL